MADLVVFDFEDATVRSQVIDGEPWFVGKDVCTCLEIANHRDALGRLEADERRDCVGIADAIGRERDTIMVSEPGVYRLVFTSRSDAAERFKRWLAHEVLPALRRTGTYGTGEGMVSAELAPHATTAPDAVDALDIDDIRKCYSILDVHRRLFGRRSAAELARRLPIPPSAAATFPAVGSIARFAGDMLVHDPEARTESGDIWHAYLAWCAQHGEAPVTRTALGRRLRELGWLKVKSNGRCVYGATALAAPKMDAA